MKWLTPKIGQIISLEYGKSLPKEKRNSEGSFTVAGSNGQDGFHSEKLIDGPGIVIGRKGSAGKITWYQNDFWPIDTTFYVKPKTNIDLKWLYYFLTKLELERLAIITGVPGINRNAIYSLNIPFPPASEQTRIVEILDQADALCKKRAEADKLAERIIPALFYKMFGDPIELINNEKSVSLEDFNIELQNGFACGQKNIKGGIPHLRMNNIDDLGYLNLDLVRTVPTEFKKQRYILSNGDLLFMATNSVEKIGKTCVFYIKSNSTYLYSNHLTRIRIKDDLISPEYLSAFLHILWTKRFYPAISKRWVNQATVSNTALKNLKVFVPDETKRLIFDKTYKELILIREQRNYAKGKIDNLFGALLYKAFSGELTAKWREAHREELLREMEIQAQYLNS